MAGNNINYPFQPIGPSRELASMQGLLSAIAERRMQQQQQEQERQRREYEFSMLQANREEDNRREAERIQMQDELARDQMAQARTLKEQEQKHAIQLEAERAVPEIQKTLQTSPDAARTLAESRRISMSPYTAMKTPMPTSPNLLDVGPMPEPPPIEPPALGEAPSLPPDPREHEEAVRDWNLDTMGNEFLQDQHAQETAAAEAANAREEEAAKGRYQLTMPAGNQIFMSALADQQARMAKMNEATRAMEKFRPAATTPYQQEAWRQVHGLVASGVLPPDKDSVAAAYAKLEADLRGEAAALERVKAAPRPDVGLSNEKKRLDIEQEYMTAAETTLAKKGYVDVVKDQRKLGMLSEQVAGAADSAALAAITAGAFTKYAQGGVGVVSDNDLRVFWERIGGLGVRTWQAVENILSGTLLPEKQKDVQKAVDQLLSASRRHEKEIGIDLVHNISALPGGVERLPRVLGTYARSYLPIWQAQQAKKNKGAAKSLNDEAALYEKDIE